MSTNLQHHFQTYHFTFQIGKWLGAASLSGDWLGLGGGPKAALWHLRTLTPLDPYLPETVTPNVGGLGNAYEGGVHALHIYGPEQMLRDALIFKTFSKHTIVQCPLGLATLS